MSSSCILDMICMNRFVLIKLPLTHMEFFLLVKIFVFILTLSQMYKFLIMTSLTLRVVRRHNQMIKTTPNFQPLFYELALVRLVCVVCLTNVQISLIIILVQMWFSLNLGEKMSVKFSSSQQLTSLPTAELLETFHMSHCGPFRNNGLLMLS